MFKTNVVTEKRPPNPVADLFLEPPLSISDAYQRGQLEAQMGQLEAQMGQLEA